MRVLLVALLLVGCAPAHVPSITAGISQDEAIRVAASQLPADSEFVSANLGNRAGFIPRDPELLDTWIVKFRGNFPRGCGPAVEPPIAKRTCPGDLHTVTVFVDFHTGEWLSAEYP